MKVHLLSGFLGSGKTTAIQQAVSLLIKKGARVGVITNDQGAILVDGNFFKSMGIPSRQVINGCFCCNYNDLNNSIDSLIDAHQPEIIFAESVGSCTDLVATVMKPLLRYRQDTDASVSTFADARLLYMLLSGNTSAFDASITYIYYKQLEDAGIIVVNKIDLMTAPELEDLTGMMKNIYKNKTLIFQNSLDAGSLQQWLRVLNELPGLGNLAPLHIDYDVYGAGEAMMAWLDEEIELFSSSNSALEEAYRLMNLIDAKISAQNYPVGHLKFLVDNKIKVSIGSVSQVSPGIDPEANPSANLLINARVQTTPEILSRIVAEAVDEISKRCTVVVNSIAAFQPGYPKPTHRIAG